MKKKNMLILLVFLLTVGFASVSTTLVMNGTIGVAEKTSDFNVIFKYASVTGNTAAKATISDNKRTITFETDKLSTVGDKAELVYKVKNDSTQYDANVIVSCTGGNPGYTTIVSEFAGKSLPLSTPELMEAQEVRMGKISVNLTKAYDASVTKTPLTCTLEIEGEGRESIVEYSICEYPDGTKWTFDYTGSEQKFIIPCKGEYKLETWGAAGGGGDNSTYYAGYGGYSSGSLNLEQGKNLYINVGGKGEHFAGGYNGGGSRQNDTYGWNLGGAGGGATHIAFKSGVLSSLSGKKGEVLIVSGGGGGTGGSSGSNLKYSGGSGGGYIGNKSVNSYTSGGTQTSGGYNSSKNTYGTFGQGSSVVNEGAGGGGWYGGSSGSSAEVGGAGAGGSGYIGNQLLTNKVMYCYNCATSNNENTKTISTTKVSPNPISNYAKSGNGYVRIALIRAN